MERNFTVVSSNANATGGFVTKISCKTTEETAFGTKTKNETYYVSGSKQLAKDSVVKINLNDWRIAEYPFELTEGDNAGEIVQLKWLHLK